MININCPYCGSRVRVVKKEVMKLVNGKYIECNDKKVRCKRCKRQIHTNAFDKYNMKHMYKKYVEL